MSHRVSQLPGNNIQVVVYRYVLEIYIVEGINMCSKSLQDGKTPVGAGLVRRLKRALQKALVLVPDIALKESPSAASATRCSSAIVHAIVHAGRRQMREVHRLTKSAVIDGTNLQEALV